MIATQECESSILKPQSCSSAALEDPQIAARKAELFEAEITFIDDARFQTVEADEALSDACERLMSPPPQPPIRPPRGTPSYLASLYQFPLLSAQQEHDAFLSMNYLKWQARGLQRRLKKPKPQADLVREMDHLLQLAEEFRNLLLRSNLRLVVSIAKKFASPQHSFDELVSEGNMTLMRAIEKFDAGRGFRFSTYATHSIRRSYYRPLARNEKERALHIANSAEIINELPSRSEWSRRAEQEEMALLRSLDRILTTLDDREQLIVRARFGLDDRGRGMSLQKIADRVGVCKERVRQLMARALAKLATAATAEGLSLDTLG